MSKNTRLSWLLLSPLLALIVVGFILPIGYTLLKAVANPEVTSALPRTTVALASWDGQGLPSEAVFTALAQDIQDSENRSTFGSMTRRLNFESTGTRSVFMKTRLSRARLTAPYTDSLRAVHPAWGQPETWLLLKQNSNPYTASYILRALDLKQGINGEFERIDKDKAIFIELFQRTFIISLWVTVLCVLLGYPTAWYISTLSPLKARLAILCVLVPFWTSILVRTTAWFILLQREGPINAFLLGAEIIDEPVTMIFTRFAVYVAMVHVLLPFMILPLYGVMTRMQPEYVKAAASLGAPPWRQFVSIYLPLTMPGVAAGAVFVFMLSVGFYVTPALVGGLRDQMVSYYIAFFANQTINLGMVAALSFMLLLFTGLSIAIARRFVPGLGGKMSA